MGDDRRAARLCTVADHGSPGRQRPRRLPWEALPWEALPWEAPPGAREALPSWEAPPGPGEALRGARGEAPA
ncbi:MAG: hypothetical protein ACLPKE_35180 [Streptosporangiaceae bacterium]